MALDNGNQDKPLGVEPLPTPPPELQSITRTFRAMKMLSTSTSTNSLGPSVPKPPPTSNTNGLAIMGKKPTDDPLWPFMNLPIDQPKDSSLIIAVDPYQPTDLRVWFEVSRNQVTVHSGKRVYKHTCAEYKETWKEALKSSRVSDDIFQAQRIKKCTRCNHDLIKHACSHYDGCFESDCDCSFYTLASKDTPIRPVLDRNQVRLEMRTFGRAVTGTSTTDRPFPSLISRRSDLYSSFMQQYLRTSDALKKLKAESQPEPEPESQFKPVEDVTRKVQLD